MKIVSIEVAKAIKEAGYPLQRFHTVSREQFEHGWGPGIYSESPSILYPEDNDFVDMYLCPTYIEVWLWLWKEKGIKLSVEPNDDETECYTKDLGKLISEFGSNPDEAIEAAIKYLVENNLIK